MTKTPKKSLRETNSYLVVPDTATALIKRSVETSCGVEGILPQRRYIPVTQWNKYHPWPPIGGLRAMIFNAETNGFKTAFKRVGRRVLIDEAEFFRCVDDHSK